jgi:hypothetical protein
MMARSAPILMVLGVLLSILWPPEKDRWSREPSVFFSLAEAPVELPAEHAELEGHVADRHACGDVWKVSGPSP